LSWAEQRAALYVLTTLKTPAILLFTLIINAPKLIPDFLILADSWELDEIDDFPIVRFK
jgi:hypothetical protein